MKIGILTFHGVPNYGAVLQANALQKYIESIGCEAEIIDYRPAYLCKYYNKLYSRWFGFHPASLRDRIIRKKIEGFPLKRSEHCFTERDELFRYSERYDIIVLGSDQIWNPKISLLDDVYFGIGCSRRIRVVSYAASFGSSKIDNYWLNLLKSKIRRCDKISVREKSGCDIVAAAGGDAVEVVDPTLLMGERYHSDLIKDIRPRVVPYVLVYNLQYSETMIQAAKIISRSKGMEIIQIRGPVNPFRRRAASVLPSVPQWIALFRDANYVITNSFHGVLFSIMFKKNFVFSGLGGAISERSERIESFLRQTGLCLRFARRGDVDSIIDILSNDPTSHWPGVEVRISNLARESKTFLRQALGGPI